MVNALKNAWSESGGRYPQRINHSKYLVGSFVSHTLLMTGHRGGSSVLPAALEVTPRRLWGSPKCLQVLSIHRGSVRAQLGSLR